MSREQANRSVARAFMRWILAAFFAAGGVAHLTAPQALVYTICLWPANIKHAIEGVAVAHIPSSWWYHGPRLVLKPVIAWWALFSAGAIDWPWRRQER